ncbi:Cysteine--tRNA ligase [Gemmata obscuriglobus]|uniref:Cysteine--tRNA ligase n=1 Tax=Gemmata obscuriglobus TaxID=114 RepID=A0A2Z3HA74_9BACT|nr:cysteine--tRNA ligase [Gemmata obscuriglobus]AWM41332.1 cysteine--tRNA ligase [Gemmata obscuriglobus]QEG25315.1 Cysteine--tRNA ligase [Gemmata obscuriglobus]VTR98207.1 cysteinyl-trna synthetase : Cysteine--tRNA ligase OS=Singulisphaera acidiphila (strain ATCC BAA-1392 / DSM 18658 / VKM B-2454 / MOB10) GN=cysS PE=3 SV=1: tRNA-synt_1e: DALR_2 [Gemmata obscuriglobus UQM 2246]
MALQVYSTLTRKKEPFHKQPGDTVTMYVCGPTVYKPSHIGHMVGPVIFDTVKRYLTYLGYKVKWVVNITDVDDKLIGRAQEQKTTVPELAAKMTEDYFACLKALNIAVSSPDGIDVFPRATQHIGGMIQVIQDLIKKDHAYEVDDGVYFDVSKDADYGKLTNRDPEQMEAGARLEPNPKKRNPGDFALWKSKPGEPAEVQFDSPFKCGRGRPGWHIECTCMAIKELGETLDIHGGGLDLQFPHHENELAQSESWTGKPFARVWMHNGLLKLKSGKMAGSLGNVLNVADALKAVGGGALRFFVLNTHYRSPIDLGDWEPKPGSIPSNLESAKVAFETFVRFAERVQRVTGQPFASLPAPVLFDPNRKFVQPALAEFAQRFHDFMDDDLNTGGVTGVLFELVTSLNRLADTTKLEDPATSNPQAKAEFTEGASLVKEIAQVLGLTFTAETKTLDGGNELVGGLMQLLLDLRANLRASAKEAAKDNPLRKALFDQTDLIRKRLGELGVTLEDRPGGTTWRVG